MAFPEWVNTGKICYDLRSGNTAYVTFRYYGDYSIQKNYYKGTVEIPETFEYNSQTYTVTGINNSAFMGCSALTKIVIPSTITEIGGDAFLDCSALDEVVFQDGPETIKLRDSKVLNSSSGMTYISGPLFQNSPVQTLYLGRNLDRSNLTKPNDVFRHPSIISLTIGKYVESIPALFSKKSLSYLKIEEGVKEIESKAFQGCSISDLRVPNSLTKIGSYAFDSNSQLQKVIFGKGLEVCEEGAFKDCKALKEVHIDELSDWLRIRFSSNSNGLHYADGLFVNGSLMTELEVNPSMEITGIPTYSFQYCASLKAINLKGVTTIGDGAFSDCASLEAINLKGVTAIGDGAFSDCLQLKTINCDASLVELGSEVFKSCGNLETVTLSNSIEKIGDSGFKDCTKLKSILGLEQLTSFSTSIFENCVSLIELPKTPTLTQIGRKAFYGCESLTNIVIPGSVNKVEENAFAQCGKIGVKLLAGPESCIFNTSAFSNTQIISLSLGRNFTGNGVFRNNTELQNVELLDGLTNIPSTTFSNCTSLNEVIFPASITSIGDRAFEGCTGIRKLSFLDGIQAISLGSGWINLTNLTDLYIGRNLTGFSSFSNAENLINLRIGNDCTTIPNSCFNNCISLQKVELPNTVTSIGSSAFSDCTALINFKFPESLQVISSDIVRGCTSITEILIPRNVEIIQSRAFENCSSLNCVRFEESSAGVLLGENVFKNCPISTLYIGSDISANYRIDSSPFNSQTLKVVEFAHGVSYVGDYMFKDCIEIESVNFPQSIKTIGSYTFSGCKNMVFNDKTLDVEVIGNNAFANCAKLSIKEISKNIQKIGSKAFFRCLIPELCILGNADIETSAFAQCSMKKLYINQACKLKSDSFSDNKLFTLGSLSSTQTTVSVVCDILNIELLNSSGEGVGNSVYIFDEGEIQSIEEKKTVTISKLTPSTQYTIMLSPGLQLGIARTKEIESGLKMEGDVYANGLSVRVAVGPLGDAQLRSAVLKCGNLKWDVKDNEVVFIPFTPQTKDFSVNPILEVIASNKTFQSSITAKIPALKWNNESAVATSLTSARLMADVNLNNTVGFTGIEWRRNDAPENVKSQEALCPVVNEKLYGSLFSLKEDIYYLFRPYYQVDDNQRYYGEWVGFYTGDALVYFEPEVVTMVCKTDATWATFEGFALAGSEEITSQGFEYRSLSSKSSNDWVVIESTGILMQTEVTDLIPNREYEYRAFVTTKTSTTYGKTVKFSTLPLDESGVEYIPSYEKSDFSILCRYVNQSGLPAIKIDGTSRNSVVRIYNLDGNEVGSFTSSPNEWVSPDLSISKGHYIIVAFDENNRAAVHVLVK